ncbi:hypothetical protein [Spirosoma gilvum]
MTSRLRPEDLALSPYKELIHTLINQCLHTELAGPQLSYQDYSRLVRTLLLTTQSSQRTRVIVEAVLAQAKELQKTTTWVEGELKFEGMLEGVDRTDFLLFELEQAGSVTDALLDQYNERLKRFSQSDL